MHFSPTIETKPHHENSQSHIGERLRAYVILTQLNMRCQVFEESISLKSAQIFKSLLVVVSSSLGRP